ncbi:DeoR family transcriptional regulator [Nostoc sp. CENA67]|uniref:DeoR family transcriptional regulator n=1 Tax=Amazonocrinis nigriterrae CENA67 TaxID=2794033 RepID=A0A8J7HWR8_9NOST|nr:DeoR family transcriptional regulator [Amazonocrinis nigriterrae CENA67]
MGFSAPSYAADTLCATVTSEAQPQSGQKNRSSGNFSTQGCGPRLKWTSPPLIVYRVMRDVSGGTDPVILGAVTNGLVTNAINERSLYIANPQNAKQSFQVTVYSTDDPTNN